MSRPHHTSGRAPRTLTEAFGPYTAASFAPPRRSWLAACAGWVRALFTRSAP